MSKKIFFSKSFQENFAAYQGTNISSRFGNDSILQQKLKSAYFDLEKLESTTENKVNSLSQNIAERDKEVKKITKGLKRSKIS